MRKALEWIGIGLGGLIALALVAATTFALIGRSGLNGRYEVSHRLPADAVSNASVEVGARIARTRGCFECHDQGLRGKLFLDIPPGRIVAPNLTKGRGGIGARYASLQDWDRWGHASCRHPVFLRRRGPASPTKVFTDEGE